MGWEMLFRMNQTLKRHSAKWQNETCPSSTRSCMHPPSHAFSGPRSWVRAAGSLRPILSLRPWGHAGQPHFSCHMKRQDWSEVRQLGVRQLGDGSALSVFLFTILSSTSPHSVPKIWLICAPWGELAISVLFVSSQTTLLRKENV